MSENKFIKHLKGVDTTKSVLEIKNQNTLTSFASMPDGTSNANDVYSDHRGDAVGVLKGSDNWKLNGQSLIDATTVYGDGRDVTTTYQATGATLWVNSTYTFNSAKRFNPNTKFVLKLCGHSLDSEVDAVVSFSLIITFGNTVITKTFKQSIYAFNFAKEFVVDFAESNANAIKVEPGDTMKVQLLCSDATANATIYNGMTVFTALQRRVDADAVSTDTRSVEEMEIDLDGKVNIDGTSVMTAPLKFASGSMRGAVGPYFNGVGFWKLDSQDNLTQVATLSHSQFIPATTNTIDLGNSTKKWKDIYIAGKAYAQTINNGSDIAVPTDGGTMVVADSTGATTGQLLLLDSNLKPVWGNTSTYLTYPVGWPTTGTTKAFCDAIAADTSAVAGKAYLGEVTLSDMPSGIGNAEIIVEIMDGTTAANKVIKLSLSSGNVAPYAWIYTYWNGGSNTSGWQPLGGDSLPSQTGNSGKFLTTDGSNTSWSTVDALPSQSGNNGKFLTTNGSTASWSDKPLVNEATPTSSLGLGYTTVNTTYTNSVNIGNGAQVLANNSIALGAFASAEGQDSIAIYSSTGTSHRARTTHTGNIAIGYNALAINAPYTIAIGYNAFAQSTNAIQLGTGQNASSGTMQVWTYKLLDKTTGLIPAARFADQTNATQGQVLTLDANLDAVWSNTGTGHNIIAFQAPTAQNDYTWYRKYEDGWVEQGGRLPAKSSATNVTVNLPIEMSDNNYFITKQRNFGTTTPGSGSANEQTDSVWNLTTTTFMVRVYSSANSSILWEVKGMYAV